MGGKRRNRSQCSFAASTPAGSRSQVWTVWSQQGTSDVYLRAIRGQDAKASLHDPLASRDRSPWVFGFTREYMERHNDKRRAANQTIVEWGPFRAYPPGPVPAVEVVIPRTELWQAETALEAPAATRWLSLSEESDAAWFQVFFAPMGDSVPPGAGDVLWRQELANGHEAFLVARVGEVDHRIRTLLPAVKERGKDLVYADLAKGEVPISVARGRHAAAGLHALPPVGTLLTILEFHWMSYFAL